MMTNKKRNKLIFKLKALIAVLQVSIRKLSYAAKQPDADVVRFESMILNLENTYAICLKALDALQKIDNTNISTSGAREYTEMTSVEEYKKFQSLEPISEKEIQDVDWGDLINKLQP